MRCNHYLSLYIVSLHIIRKFLASLTGYVGYDLCTHEVSNFGDSSGYLLFFFEISDPNLSLSQTMGK